MTKKSDEMPEPSPLRYHLDRAREEVSDKLQKAYVEGYVTDEELDERLDLANQADSLASLERLVVDLPEPRGELVKQESTELAPQTQSRDLIPSGPRQERTTLRAIFGGVERGDHWDVPKVIEIQAIFGGVELDFREALLPEGEATIIRASVIMGGIEITIPPGVRIDDQSTAILGGVSIKDKTSQEIPFFHTLRLEGIVLFGGIDIRVKKEARKKKIFGFLE